MRVFIIIVISLTTMALSMWLAVWASETLFFDKFYYYKSVKHGYWVPDKNLTTRDFGKRGQDIANLSDFIRDPQHNTLGAQTDKNVFTIAVFGDSFAWGQGIKEQERFVSILEQKLNKIRPTKILSFANSGDGIVETYIKYLYVLKNVSTDFFLFTLVNNDLLLHKKSLYNDAIQQQAFSLCNSPLIFYPPTHGNQAVPQDEYYLRVLKSYNDRFGNRCVFRFILGLLPKRRAKYFYYGSSYWGDLDLKEALSEYEKLGLDIFSADSKITKELTNKLRVSKLDGHPSALANKLFSDAIYDEIIKMDYFYR